MKTARAEAALEYIEHGFQVIPLKAHDKVPATTHGLRDCTDNPEQVEFWWGFGRHERSRADFNVGIVCGEQSGGLIVIDIDTHGANGMQTLHEFELQHGALPETVTAITGTGGKHLFYRSARELHPFANPKLGIDLRAEGSYIVAPPSIHPNGEVYEWSTSLDDMEPAQANDTVYALIDYCAPTSTGVEGKDSKARFQLPKKIDSGGRNDLLFRYACSLRSIHRPKDEIYNSVLGANFARCTKPLSVGEVGKIVDSAWTYDEMDEEAKDEAEGELRRPKRTKSGKVDWPDLAEIIKADDHCCKIDGVLSVWNGRRWCSTERDINVRSRIRANDLTTNQLNEVYRYLLDMTEDRYANTSFDNGHYVQFRNVTIDARTLHEVEPTPDMYISATLNCDWQPDIGANEADMFFESLSAGRADIKQLMLETLGNCMLGKKAVKKASMLIGRSKELDGNASNGKSSYIELVRNILGNDNASFLTLHQLSQRFMTHMLFGKLANLGDDIPASFVDDNAASDFKKLVTGETMTADVKNKAQVVFQPNTTLIFSMNDIPRWSNMGGISRRLAFTPFFAHFRPDKPGYIKDIKSVLGKEEVKSRAALLALQTLPELIERGSYIYVPEMEEELAGVIRDNDPVERWIYDAEIYINDIVGKTSGDVYRRYSEWCDNSGERGVSLVSFGKKLKQHVWTDCNGEHWQAGQQKTGGHRVYTALKVE